MLPIAYHHLLLISAEYRWDLLRRHPLYLQIYRAFIAAKLRNYPDTKETLEGLRVMLKTIGIEADPLPPETDASVAMETLGFREWLKAAARPVTFRSIFTMLLTLPVETQAYIAGALAAANQNEASYRATLKEVLQRVDPALDSSPNDLVIHVNAQAAVHEIKDCVEELIHAHRKRREIPAMRRRDDKILAQLQVWDLRERWTGSGYDLDPRPTFSEIAGRLGMRRTTAIDQYQRAFFHVTGYPYSLLDWMWLFREEKLHRLTGSRIATWRRQFRVPGTPEAHSGLGSDTAEPEHCPSDSAVKHLPTRDEVTDIIELMEKGWDDQRIMKEMELPDAAVIQILRQQWDELPAYLSSAE